MDIHGHTAADYAPFSNSYSGRGHMWHSTGQGIAGSHTATYPIWTTTPVQVPTAPNMTGTTATAPAAVARVRTCRLTRDSVPAVRIRAIPTTIEALRASGVPELHKDEVRYGVYNNHPGFARSDIIIGSPRTVYVFRPGAAVGLGTDLTGVDC